MGTQSVASAPPPASVEVDLVLPPEAPEVPEPPKPTTPEPQETPEERVPSQPVEPPRARPTPASEEQTGEPPPEQQGAPAAGMPEVLASENGDSGFKAPSGNAAPGEARERPRLSLDALGIGAHNPFLDAGPPSDGKRRKPTAQEAQARLNRSLTNDIARADQARGLGPEGAVVASLEQATRRSPTPPNSSALFRLSTDGNGALVGIQVIEASAEPGRWKELGDRVLLEYAQKKLQGAHGARGLTFEIRITSSVTHPSGGQAPVSVTKPSWKDALPSLKGDLSDIGSRPVRSVHAQLERIWAN